MQVDAIILRRAAHVLDQHKDFAWTVQGFGMIRTYLDPEKEWRLNVWDNRLKIRGVSEIHDHPWDFESWVLAGEIANTRFDDWGAVGEACGPPSALPFQHIKIVTGEGGGPVGMVDQHYLTAHRPEIYLVGQGYKQLKDEIHVTKAVPGTVTLNRRTPATAAHTANIFWPRGPWINAEPRQATKAEQYSAIEQALYQARLDRWSRM